MMTQQNIVMEKHDLCVPVEKKFWQEYSDIILNNTTTAIIAIDREERITLFNRQAEHDFAKKAKDVIGLPLKQVFPHLADHEHYLLLALHQQREFKDTERYYCPYTNKRGVFSHTVTVVKNARGQIGGAIWLRRDLTCERRLQQEISNAAIQATVSQIAAGTAHEIRNPLTTARGYIQFALSQEGKPVTSYLKTALQEIDQIDRIITELLSFFQPRENGLQFININNMIEDLLGLTQDTGSLSNIHFKSSLDKNMPLCLADATQIKHALLHILRNAMEALPQGGTIAVNSAYGNIKGEICITVCDSGKGIKQEDLAQVFRPFFTTKETGLGLGLTLANRIVQHHGGQIKLESTWGKGTKVSIHLPADYK
ncbi:MAG: PAS domain-containing protein [Firmicutes bacterium]|nr:PAS domain-containing protein [Bacillota bacterium]